MSLLKRRSRQVPACLTAVAAAVVLAAALGCYDYLDWEVPLDLGVTTLEGSESLAAAGVTVHGTLLEPVRVDKLILEDVGDVSSIELIMFRLEVAPDALSGPEDKDDLQFIKEMRVMVDSAAEDSHLPEHSIAFYERTDEPLDDPSGIIFEVEKGKDLQPYIEGGFTLGALVTHGVPADDVAVRMYATFLLVVPD